MGRKDGKNKRVEVMFCKLKYGFETPIYAVTGGLQRFTGEDGQGIHYKKIWSPESEKLFGVLPKRYWDDFHLTCMTINTRIPPHIDSDIICTINFYIQTDNCKTVFYKSKTDNPKTFKIENQTNGCIYDENDLEEVDSFIAQPGEVWLLDASQIHSVEPLGDFKLRKAITLGTWAFTYDQICDMIRETGNL